MRKKNKHCYLYVIVQLLKTENDCDLGSDWRQRHAFLSAVAVVSYPKSPIAGKQKTKLLQNAADQVQNPSDFQK